MRKKYPIILLDLDGTIIDSAEGITKSVVYALEKLGIAVEDRSALTPFIGPPLTVGFSSQYPQLTSEQVDFAVKEYRERYRDIGVLEHSVYEGIPEMLEELQKAGQKAILATSKPQIFAQQILEHNHLEGYFYDIVGCGLDGSLDTKAEVIAYAMQKNNLSDTASILMVGDTHYDILGAKENHIESAGVLYGFGSKKTLEAAGAEYIFSTVQELREFLLG